MAPFHGTSQRPLTTPLRYARISCFNQVLIRQALRDAYGRYRRYGRRLGDVRTVDDMLDLNKQEFGSFFGGTEHFATGAIFGYCSGFAIRKASRKMAFFCGLSFMGLQYLNYRGYVSVRWQNVFSNVESKLDLNNDGKVDDKDFQIAKRRVMEILTFGLPSTVGFGTGFAFGWRGKLL
eukprot:Blabericola_migrator_1__10380@NODE_585_length_7468_cov_222_283070_g432_i0_p4_GENE_NODE_585_length_7468_cov_222_283070_g432_i0NODE_585_length_7468_cov_222_283070_g432_i0_p4_ORF_typecomplete_len178_score21_26FUN14/PF04930_15/1_9e22Dockerin_1/PF00404_18/0_0082EFhand_5/PF13202_6/5_9e03EFhand_5/PF13202_6/0_14_NODE_585_length_7468_cov_222_283070_g432_i05451078